MCECGFWAVRVSQARGVCRLHSRHWGHSTNRTANFLALLELLFGGCSVNRQRPPQQVNLEMMSVVISAGKKIKLGVVIASDREGAAGVCVCRVVSCVMP